VLDCRWQKQSSMARLHRGRFNRLDLQRGHQPLDHRGRIAQEEHGIAAARFAQHAIHADGRGRLVGNEDLGAARPFELPRFALQRLARGNGFGRFGFTAEVLAAQAP